MSAAWEQDADWGTFVWLTFITGARRGELLGLAWEHLDLPAALLTIRRNLVRQNGKIVIKETKTHQMRVVSLDPDTVAILTAHKQRAQRCCTEVGTTLDDDTFVFSYTPDHRRHCDPDGITHRYSKMTADLGLDTHLHALRHYSATELKMSRVASGASFGKICELLLPATSPFGLDQGRLVDASSHAS